MSNKEKPFMSNKEKDYIAYRVESVMRSEKREINYGDILSGNKITYDLSRQRKSYRLVFGKQTKKSKKWQRKSVSTASGWMKGEIALAELQDLQVILACVALDEQGYRELEENGCEYFESSFRDVSPLSGFFPFLAEFFSLLSSQSKNKIFDFLIKSADQIERHAEFSEFLEMLGHRTVLSDAGCAQNLWTTESGYVLGRYLLKKEPENYRALFDSFMGCPTVPGGTACSSFVDSLYRMASKNEKEKIRQKTGKL